MTNKVMPNTPKNRLGVANYLIFPRIQIKYAAIYTFIVVLTIVFFMAGELFFLSQGEQFGLDQTVLDSFKMSLMKYNLIVMFMSGTLTFMISILITHRFLGPVIAIRRALDSYTADKTFKKINIRKTDEVHGLVEHLNSFIEGLDGK